MTVAQTRLDLKEASSKPISTQARWLRVAVPIALIVTTVFGAGAISVAHGQDVNFDQLRSHYYNLFWLFHGRQTDFFPAHVGGLFPSLWNIPWYVMVNRVNPRVTAGYLGALDGIALVLVATLTWRLVASRPSRRAAVALVVFVTVIAASGPAFRGEFGTTFGDVATAIPFFAGLVALCWSGKVSSRPTTVFLAMCLIGMSVGLKWTQGPWAIAALLGLLFATGATQRWISCLTALGGLFVGFLVAYGPWSILMFQDYGSPTFPFFNAIFHSADYLPVNFRDHRWVIGSPLDVLSLPVRWLTTSRETSQAAMRDWRWFVLLVLGAIWLIQRAFRALDFRPPVRGGSNGADKQSRDSRAHVEVRTGRFIVTLVLAGYVLSMWQLAYTRYLVVGEMLAGLAMLVILEKIWTWRASLVPVVVGLAAVVLALTSYTQNWGIVPLGQSWFGVNVHSPPRNALVLVAGGEDQQYVLPFLPRSDQFGGIGTGSEAFGAAYRRFRSEASSFRGSVFLLSPTAQSAWIYKPVLVDLARYKLRFVDNQCTSVGAVTGPMFLCRLDRVQQPASQGRTRASD